MRQTKPLYLRLLSLALTLPLVLGSSAVALGGEPSAHDQGYYRVVEARIRALEARGAGQAEIDAMLAGDFGWLPAGEVTHETDEGFQALGVPSASDVTFNYPSVYWNSQLLRYEARATWQWKNCGSNRCWYENYPRVYNGYIGGPDGFALRLSKNVHRIASSLTVFDESNWGRSYSVPETFNDAGVGYSEQDYTRSGQRGYVWDHGTIYMSFTLRECYKGYLIKLDTKMGHTWQSTSVDSISIGTGGITITFSSASNQWTGVSNPTNWYPCGS